MHVVMLSDTVTSGGAAIAASRLAEALMQANMKVTRIVGKPDGLERSWKSEILQVKSWEKRILRPINFVHKDLARYFESKIISLTLDRLLMNLNPDFINVHNLHGAKWSIELLNVCARHAPTVWTLHDMWSFTGRCAYNYNCNKFIDGCDALCQTPTEYPSLSAQLISDAWNRRERFFRKHHELVAVSPSRWLAREARKGFWKDNRVEVIPNGLPLEVYKPVDKNLSRTALEIETNTPVLLMAAYNLNAPRKGGEILVNALQKTSLRPLTLVTFGRGAFRVKIDDIKVYQMGYVNPERVKALVYNASDMLIHPAPVDNLPNVVMEAIACGTPVVAFPVGGVTDMVRPGRTGWLADEVSPEELAETIDSAIEDLRQGVKLQDSCRDVAEAEYSSELQAKRYIELFESL